MTAAADGVRIAVRLSPKARANRVDCVARDGEGAVVLKVSVVAPPLDGRANQALLELLAREWRLPRRDLALVGGARNRNKLVAVAGDPATLMPHLASVLAALAPP